MFGQEGIITKAQEAARKTAEASQNEQEFLDYATDYIADYLHGAGEKTLTEKMADAGITGDPESLYDVVDGVPIPKGFKVSSRAGENTKAGGLVIIDEENGNEFVWIPVRELEPDGTIDGIKYDEQFGRRTFGRIDSLGGTERVADKYTEDIDQKVITSVERYGGFYIARYQASYDNGKVSSKPSTTVTDFGWENINGRLWNWITQSSARVVCGSTYGEEAAVIGHLPYGAEWDSVLQWFKQTEFSDNDAPIGLNSVSWGNYRNALFTYGEGLTKPSGASTLINTGSTEYTKVNNIYDMTGNLMEWTQEKYSTGLFSAARGGHYNTEGDYSAAAYRGVGSGTDNSNGIGFRLALYIK